MLMKEFKKSIKYDLLKIIVIILFISTVALSAILAVLEGAIHESSLMNKGHGLAFLLGKLSQDPLLLKDSILLDAIVHDAIKDDDVVYAVISDSEGKILTSLYASIDFSLPRLKAALAKLSRESDLPDYIAAIKKAESIQEITAPIIVDVKTMGAVTVGLSKHSVRQLVAQTVLSVLTLNVLVALALGIALFYSTTKKIIAPISQLAGAADRLAQGDLSTRVDVKSAGEVQRLIDSFNRMAGDLERTTVSKNYVNDIIASMRDTLIVVSPDGSISRINMAASFLLGYSDTELVGQQLSRVVLDEPGSQQSVLETVLENSSISSVEKFYLDRKGKRIPMLFSASVMRGVDGDIQGIVCVAQNMTDRKKAEEALRESAASLSATLNATADGILAIGASGEVLFYNQRFTEMWNIPKAILNTGDDNALLGHVLTQLSDPDAFVKEVKRLYDSNESSFDTIYFKDDRVFERYSFPLHQEASQPLGRVWSFRDITERKRAEIKLHNYSVELEKINEELKSFAYIVSHDLRAPLVNIRGFSEELIHGISEIGPLLEKYLDGFEENERKKFSVVLKKDIPEALLFISSSVKRMDGLISVILKLSRVGRQTLAPERLQVQEMVTNIVNSLTHQIESRNTRVRIGDLAEITTDRTALEQIFGNLLDNAIKYLEPGRPGEIAISAEEHGDEIIFHVRDNGRGMAAEDIPKAFEIFRRVGRQDTPGEGMGLAYVKTLVRLLGGRIWCESTPDEGAVFSFALPRVTNTAVATTPGEGGQR